jgi:ATP-binding cassette subfamily F protein uup
MDILEIRNLIYKVPHKILCDDISFSIWSGEKVALLAKNWAGKSTLLKLISGELEAFSGTVEVLSRIRVWYLAQAEEFDPQMTVIDAIFAHASEIGQLIKLYEHKLTTGDTTWIEKIMQRIEEMNGRDYETNVRIVINKLQLSDLLERKIEKCSGGEIKRVALAKVLIDDPDFLVLDEPTNHLDVEMIAWLEWYLKKLTRTVLIVTHDRYFMERICNRIIELDLGDLYNYPGNYSRFLEMKAKREEDAEQDRHEMRQFLKAEREWMAKAPRARESKSVKREKEFVEHEVVYSEMKRQSLDHKKRLDISLVKRRIWGKILKLHNIEKSYGEKVIVDNFSYDFRAGERVWLIGKNGVGKSTFIKLLAGEEDPDNGAVRKWKTIHMWIYQQKQRRLDPTKTVLDIVKEVATSIEIWWGKRVTAKQMLDKFMFPPRQQHQKAQLLSGWEQRRLTLLLTLIKNPNFLILDEPTNDLDIMTLGMLEDFLQAYTWCLVIISHDRMFMDKIVDHLLVFEWDGVISDFPWGYTAWEQDQFDKKEAETQKSDTLDIVDEKHIDEDSSTQKVMQQQAQKKKSLSNKERDEYQRLWEEIERLELRKDEINNTMAWWNLEHKQLKEIWLELAQIATKLETYEVRWLELAERT